MQFKHDVGQAFQPGAIVALCRSIGHVWRTRQLDPVVTLQGFLLQILHGNTACSHVPRLLGKEVTAEAYGQARSRLPLEFFQRLLEEVCSRLRGSIDTTSSWHGHRVWVIDGSSCSMPDTPELQQAFGQPSGQATGCGFPVAHLMTLRAVGQARSASEKTTGQELPTYDKTACRLDATLGGASFIALTLCHSWLTPFSTLPTRAPPGHSVPVQKCARLCHS